MSTIPSLSRLANCIFPNKGLFTFYISQNQGFQDPPSLLRQQWSAFAISPPLPADVICEQPLTCCRWVPLPFVKRFRYIGDTLASRRLTSSACRISWYQTQNLTNIWVRFQPYSSHCHKRSLFYLGKWSLLAICPKHGGQRVDDGNQQGSGDRVIFFLECWSLWKMKFTLLKMQSFAGHIKSINSQMIFFIYIHVPQGWTIDGNPSAGGLYREQCSSRYRQGLSMMIRLRMMRRRKALMPVV